MSDNHEKFQNGFDPNNGSEPANTNTSANNAVNSTNAYGTYHNAQYPTNNTPAYTWNAQSAPQQNAPVQPNGQPVYYGVPVHQPQKQPKPKKHGSKFGLKLLAVVLCCAITSAASLGVFVAMIQNGFINVQSSEASSNAAFTISRVVNGDTSSDTSASSDGTVSAMSDQDIAAKLTPSVVCIQNYQVTQNYGFMQTDTSDSSVSPASEGSGIIMSEDGYIITNAHVVEGATSLKVMTSDGETYEAQLIGSDTVTDLAVVKIDATGLTAAEFGSSEDLRVADKVMAIGNPGGHELSSSVTIGYVSALNRAIANNTTGYTMEYIQTDAAINPGNSGGALINEYGQVVGINSAKISATGYEGLGFAIPIDTAQPIISDLIQYGYVKDRAVLGISGQFIDSMTGRFYGLPQGEYVAQLNSSEAQASGLQVGDVITAIDGQQLDSESTLRSAILSKKPGDTVTLQVYRSSTQQSATVELKLSEYSAG
ncbi:trypsin-like peptidase domain-containing protein [Neglectibacter sp. CSJ-5]|uniref:S1C family serine protease n=1 Tax=Neglectibacter sp. CSJ-5 TaxID=3078043 RepID=UPI00292F7D8A|nr:trypsin-like peptidase domain-containing protein [Neglectibacter sp. CSJ-5]